MPYLESLNLGNFEAIGNDSGVQSLGDEAVGLLQELAHEEDDRGGAIAADVVLSSRSSGNHDGRRVLYLHLAEKNVSILCKLNLYAGERKPRLAHLRIVRVSWAGWVVFKLEGRIRMASSYLTGTIDKPGRKVSWQAQSKIAQNID